MPELLTSGVGGGEEQPGFRGLLPALAPVAAGALPAITAPKWNLVPNVRLLPSDTLRQMGIAGRVRVTRTPPDATAEMWLPSDQLQGQTYHGDFTPELTKVHETFHIDDWNRAPTFMSDVRLRKGRWVLLPETDLKKTLAEVRAGLAEEAGGGSPGIVGRNITNFANAKEYASSAAQKVFPRSPDPLAAMLRMAKENPAQLHEYLINTLETQKRKFPTKVGNILRQTIPNLLKKAASAPTDLALNLIPQSLLQQMSDQIQGPQG